MDRLKPGARRCAISALPLVAQRAEGYRPIVRGRFFDRTWTAFCALAGSALLTWIVAPGLVLLFIRIFTFGLLSPLDWVLAVTGSGSGFPTAIPYFFLTNPKRPR
jgi:hypothetical protein